ncbi:unnamed protein product [marine sediment metagenome]|uniref:Uncharacterized protein n=1 Tax=marine sediment metagenome TaxID=412755 RepID=X1IAW5_9ZZZZ
MKSVPNDIRQAFLGLLKEYPNIPQKAKVLMGYEEKIIQPIHFALIKKLIRIGLPDDTFALRFHSVNAIIIYDYRGIDEDLESFLIKFNKYLRKLVESKRLKYISAYTNYKIIIGKDSGFLEKQ